MEKKQTNRLLNVLIMLSLLLSVSLGIWLIYENTYVGTFAGQSMQQASKYTLYIGTHDATTNTQTAPTEEMKAEVDSICKKYVDGFTAFRANGNWLDDTGTQVCEDTLVYCFYNTTDEQIEAILDEVLVEFNQSTILTEKANAEILFYNGAQ